MGRTRCPGPRQANAVGVWGNHDIGLCHWVEERIRARHPAAALDCLAAPRPRPVVGGCHYSHVEPPVLPVAGRVPWVTATAARSNEPPGWVREAPTRRRPGRGRPAEAPWDDYLNRVQLIRQHGLLSCLG